MEFFKDESNMEVPEMNLDSSDTTWKTSTPGAIITVGKPAEATTWTYITTMLINILMTIIARFSQL